MSWRLPISWPESWRLSVSWPVLAPTIALAVILICYTAYWFVQTDILEAQAERFIADQAEEGREVSYESLGVTGFPYRMAVRIDGLTVEDRQHPAHWIMQAQEVTVHVLPYALDHLIVVFSGDTVFSYDVGEGDTAQRATVTAAAQDARASLVFEDDVRVRFSAQFDTLEGVRQGASDGAIEEWRVDKLQAYARPQPTKDNGHFDYDFALRGEGVDGLGFIAPGVAAILGGQIQSFVAETRLSDMPVESAGDFEEMISVWARNGGSVQLASGLVEWGKINVSAAGVVSFDEETRPDGQIMTKITGHDELVDILEASGVISGDAAAITRIALGALVATNGDEEGRVSLPMNIQSGSVYLGPIKIFEVGPLF